MNKNILFALTVFLLFLLSCDERPAEYSPPSWWVWMGANTAWEEADWQNACSRLKRAGITGILMGADTASLRKAGTTASEYDMEVHAWFWTMNRGEAPAKWLSVNRQGKSLAEQQAYVGYYKFMSPALPEVKKYLSEKIKELCSVEGISGIHFDYIRYVDVFLPVGLQPKYGLVQDHQMAAFDYGYHPYMRRLYRDSTGLDPLTMDSPEECDHWHRFRLDRLNETVFMLRDQIREEGLAVSSAVFPTPAMSRRMVRQDWGNWQLDYFFPMVYHNFYNKTTGWIGEVVQEGVREVHPASKVYCGLYLPSLQDPGELEKAIHAALGGGADGVSFFNYGNLNDELLEVIHRFTRNQQTAR
jgi:uncharacterized lipoprotein YddW (UPF0748 family)